MQRIQTVGIRGAGLAGVSVACELLRADDAIRISLFDTRPRLPHPQRTFCFFRPKDEHIPSTLPFHTWNSVLFRGPTFERRIDVSTSPYTMIRGDDFFEHSLQRLEQGGVSFHWSCEQVEVAGDALRVGQETHMFDHVIDAAFNPLTAAAMMWQSFGGVWVKTTNPSFDPTTATLMDLQESSSEAPVSFLYILPTSQHTALIEHTTFSPATLPQDYHAERCLAWLERNCVGRFELQHTERGAIPMGLYPTNTGPVTTVGTNAGTVRPATGYAFLATQAQARDVCSDVLAGVRHKRRTYPTWLALGDTLFLRALLQAHSSGGTLLAHVLSRSPSEALIAFLSGRVTPMQALSVWFAAPKVAMMRALLRI